MQKVTSFLSRVRAVRNHDSVRFIRSEELIHSCCKLQPQTIVHVLTAYLGELFSSEFSKPPQAGHCVDQLFHSDFTGTISCVGLRSGLSGDSAPCGQNMNSRHRRPPTQARALPTSAVHMLG